VLLRVLFTCRVGYKEQRRRRNNGRRNHDAPEGDVNTQLGLGSFRQRMPQERWSRRLGHSRSRQRLRAPTLCSVVHTCAWQALRRHTAAQLHSRVAGATYCLASRHSSSLDRANVATVPPAFRENSVITSRTHTTL
jgi:hypothetical protein